MRGRTLRTRLVSVAQAARVAGMDPNALVRCLNQAAGLRFQGGLAAPSADESGENSTSEVETTEELDVRPQLARGEEPRSGPEDVSPPRCARDSCQPPEVADSESVIRLDVSDLVPPEPMVRVLETASKLTAGQTLLVVHHRRPVYLYPQLDAQGFVHETNELGPGRVQIVIRRA